MAKSGLGLGPTRKLSLILSLGLRLMPWLMLRLPLRLGLGLRLIPKL